MGKQEYRDAHEALASEFAPARAVIEARVTAGLTQSVIARLESGRNRPSTQTLERLATAPRYAAEDHL